MTAGMVDGAPTRRALNWRRGFFRVWIILSVLWWLYVALVFAPDARSAVPIIGMAVLPVIVGYCLALLFILLRVLVDALLWVGFGFTAAEDGVAGSRSSWSSHDDRVILACLLAVIMAVAVVRLSGIAPDPHSSNAAEIIGQGVGVTMLGGLALLRREEGQGPLFVAGSIVGILGWLFAVFTS